MGYETWVLNDNAFNPVAYTGWPFNSFALYRGVYYGASEAGLYQLDGPDQDGEGIHSGVRIGPVNFSTNRQKRLRAMRLGVTGDEVQVRLAVESGDEGYFALDGDEVPVSSDLQGKNWILDVQDFEELDFMEINPLVLVTR